ncbi:MFS transporter, DHA1 family, bicyclomycin/chloramphenicol resistance protein [Mucilaginibacter lappiensis]|uniref:DHA1 family bicyclomycin/chloramphenicol resistance-like MFS transporter n=1 Tax=Mucilaginibacter lappiensis TaxID=354630 RepID=A0ABR6PLP5_9SPHI|nr:multidrug effflux MFS transporter [Mucilaginibacter lappiensis]MBB6109920.1 DHA1 family bicyclomycin/chloramphenicol resistance-like MFS transporter [Mucilaginibacter lappiensis]SIR20029.1 MFS transporter, DHA1 family, bicyclomycin/chloramphenicol resistance protein [Mucilaginibacter lappiensis]
MTKKRYVLLILILGSLTALGPFSIDMYLPGFVAIAKYLGTTSDKMALTLTSYFIGISVGQLLYGPLLDRYGRKNPLYFGLGLYIAASIGCFFSTSLEMLIVMRFFQAIGSCAASVAAMAMVRDLFPVEENAKVFSLLILVLGASPMLAPTIGSYITAAFEWQVIFLILTIIAVLILLAVIFFLPESYQPDPSYSLKPRPIIGNFLHVLKNKQFLTYSLCGAFAFAGLFAYVSSSSIVFIDVFKVSQKSFGWIFAGLSVGFIGSSQLNSVLMKKYKSEQLVYASLIWLVFTSVIFLIGSLNGWFGIGGTITMIFGVLCGVGISYPNTAALSLAPFTKNAGSASALLGAFQMAIGALASFGIALIKSQSPLPMAAVMAVSAVVALLTLLIGKRFIKHKVEASADSGIIAH